jgi:hypothetical protein
VPAALNKVPWYAEDLFRKHDHLVMAAAVLIKQFLTNFGRMRRHIMIGLLLTGIQKIGIHASNPYP